MRVKECMCERVIWTKPNDTVETVAKLMNTNHIGCLPVCDANDQDKIVGFVTDRDIILRVVACGKDAKTTPISDVMTTEIIKTTPDTELEAATEIMSRNQIRRMPVIQDGDLVGILTLGDIAKAMPKESLGSTVECICGWSKKNNK